MVGIPGLMGCLLQTQLSPGPSGAYRECLGKLELQYAKLLVRGWREWGVGVVGPAGDIGWGLMKGKHEGT